MAYTRDRLIDKLRTWSARICHTTDAGGPSAVDDYCEAKDCPLHAEGHAEVWEDLLIDLAQEMRTILRQEAK